MALEATPNVFVGLISAVLALLFAYVPGFKTYFEKLDSDPNGSQKKQLIMLGLLLVLVVGSYVLSCFSPFVSYTCNTAGIWEAVFDFVMALAINVGVYKGTKYIGKSGPEG